MRATAALQRVRPRLQLTTKQTNKGYYKGTGTGSMGSHTKHGGYIIDRRKVRTFVCPDLTDFKLTPFVTKKLEGAYGTFPKDGGAGPLSGIRYFNRWVEEGSG